MIKFVCGMNEHKNKDSESGVSSCDPQILSFYENEYDRLINQGRYVLEQMQKNEWGYTDFYAMLNRLTNYKDSYMLFVRDYKAPFTNNLAERDLRAEKTKQKISGTFRSWDGVVTHTKIRSFISTAKKRGKELLLAITKVIKGEPVLLT